MQLIASRAEIIYNELKTRLAKAGLKENSYNFIKNLLLIFIVGLFVAFIFVLLEHFFHFRSIVRSILVISYIFAFFSSFIFILGKYILRLFQIYPEPLINYSKKVGNKFETIKDSLSNSLSLYEELKISDKKLLFSKELIYAGLEQIKERTGGVDLSSFIVFRKLYKTMNILLVSILVYILSFAFFPDSLFSSLNRLYNFNYEFITNEYGISFIIEPGDTEVLRGDNLSITIKFKSIKPDLKIDEINFHSEEIMSDGTIIARDDYELKANASDYFTTMLKDINNDIIYYVDYKGIESKRYKLSVVDYPAVKSFFLTIHPPDFTKLPSQTMPENEGDIFCIEGSKIHVDLKSNKELSSAAVIYNGKNETFSVDGINASGSFIAEQIGNYHFFLKDKDGKESKNHKIYKIQVLSNEPPTVTVIEPSEQNLEISSVKDILVRSRITDDFGFSKLALNYRKLYPNASASPSYISLYIQIKNLDATILEVPYVWNIAMMKLSAGQSVEYYVEVTDNTGKTGRSDTRTLRYKTLNEILKKSENIANEIKVNLKSVYDYSQNLQKDVQELKKGIQEKEELGLNEKKKNLQNKLENLQKNLNSLQQKLENTITDLQQRNVLNDKTLEQFMKLQEMFKKINTPELQEMIKKMLEAIKKNNMEELKEALKNFHFDEEAFRKQMEKLMELMKKIENLQKIGELTKKLDDITKQQKELKEKTEQTGMQEQNKMNTLSNEQKDIEEKTSDFKEEMNKLSQELKKMPEEFDSENLDKVLKGLEQKKTESKMQRSSSDLLKGRKKESENTQNDIINDLSELNEQMQNALESNMNIQSGMKKTLDKMKKIKEEIEKLSEEQEELKDKTEDIEKKDTKEFQQAEKEQRGLQKRLSGSIDDIMNLSKSGLKITPELGKELGNAYNSMDKAGNQLEIKNQEGAVKNQEKAKSSLDNIANMLGDMMEKLQQEGKGDQKGQGKMSQLMSQLAQIIAQQQALAEQMQKFGKDGQMGKDGTGNPDNLTNEQKLTLEKLKLEQEQIKKSLEELNWEFEEEKKRSGEKLLGDLNQIQKDMQEVIKDLSENRLDEETLERQNRILSRLLDAQLSQREKDYEQKRESRPGENIIRISPPEIVILGPKSFNAFKEEFLKLQRAGFTEEYEALITKYLLNLNNKK